MTDCLDTCLSCSLPVCLTVLREVDELFVDSKAKRRLSDGAATGARKKRKSAGMDI